MSRNAELAAEARLSFLWRRLPSQVKFSWIILDPFFSLLEAQTCGAQSKQCWTALAAKSWSTGPLQIKNSPVTRSHNGVPNLEDKGMGRTKPPHSMWLLEFSNPTVLACASVGSSARRFSRRCQGREPAAAASTVRSLASATVSVRPAPSVVARMFGSMPRHKLVRSFSMDSLRINTSR